MELTGGTAGSITRVASGLDHWNYPVTPAGDDDVYINPARAVRLLWRAPLSDGGSEITHHEYRQRIDNTSLFGADWLAWTRWEAIPDSTPGGQNGESFTVTELKNDRQYQFELRAVNAIGSTQSQPR